MNFYIRLMHFIWNDFFQYYRQARLKALSQVFPDMFDKETEMLCIKTEASRRRYNYPRPYSEPPSPSSSRPTTPGASLHGSDDEEDIDDEREVIIHSHRNISYIVCSLNRLLLFICSWRNCRNTEVINCTQFVADENIIFNTQYFKICIYLFIYFFWKCVFKIQFFLNQIMYKKNIVAAAKSTFIFMRVEFFFFYHTKNIIGLKVTSKT